jgi:hypothetical protein
VARVWSNAAAMAGADPCVPAPSGETYFNSAAILPDAVGWALPFQGAPTQLTKGVHIPVGGSANVDLHLFSQSPTAGPWSVSAQDLAALNGQTPQLQFTFDQTSGKAGDTIHMTVHVVSAGQGNAELFAVTSTLGSQKEYWFGLVGD